MLGRPAGAQSPAAMSELPLPGGLKGAGATVNSHGAAIRSQFLLDVIRRSFEAPIAVKGLRRESVLQTLLAYLDRSSAAPSLARGTAAGFAKLGYERPS